MLVVDDCRAAYEKMRARGVEFTQEPIDRYGSVDAGFRDPSGNGWKMIQARKGIMSTRQFHRWTSIAFTLTVIANFVAMSQGTPPAWITYSPLLPLALLLFTGLYLFVQPYLDRWREARRHAGERLATSARLRDEGAAALRSGAVAMYSLRNEEGPHEHRRRDQLTV